MYDLRRLVVSFALLSLLGAADVALARLVGNLEQPGAGGECVGVGNIRGWVYSTTGSALRLPLQVYIDGQKSMDVPCCGSRNDVPRTHPDAPSRTGFSGVLNFQLLPPGKHEIEVKVESVKGEKLSLKSTCTSLRIGADTLLSDLDLDNGGEGYCETDLQDPTLVCCEGVRTDGPTGPQICRNVCYRWDKAAQGMVMTSGPVLANPLCHSAD